MVATVHQVNLRSYAIDMLVMRFGCRLKPMTSHLHQHYKVRIVIAGSLPPPIGGTTVLLQNLIDAIRRNPDVQLKIVETGRSHDITLRNLFLVMTLPWRLVAASCNADVVSIHCSSPSTMGLPALLVSRVLNKPFIVRKFGGNDYRDTGGFWFRSNRLSEFVLRHADLCLLETRELVSQARGRGLDGVFWFPNHRPLLETTTDKSIPSKNAVCRRFVYVSHVRESKGIYVLAEAARQLPPDVTVDVYGPWFPDVNQDIFNATPNVKYRGIVAPDSVVSTLRQYDAFILPTYHPGEGYPGAILEAFIAGLPVITTQWRAIPEIVDESVGILVEPKNAKALCGAMQRLINDADLYQTLRDNTKEKAKFFSSQRWADEFVKRCRSLLGPSSANGSDLNEGLDI